MLTEIIKSLQIKLHEVIRAGETYQSIVYILLGSACPNPATHTVEPALKDRPIGHKNIAYIDRWSLVTGSVALKSGIFCQGCGPSRQVVSHESGLSRQVSLYHHTQPKSLLNSKRKS